MSGNETWVYFWGCMTSMYFSGGSAWNLCTTEVPGSSQLCQPRVSHSASRQGHGGKGGPRVLLGGVILSLKADSILPSARQDLFANSCSLSRLLNALLKRTL